MSKSSRNKEKPVHVANAKMLYLRLFRYAWRYKAFFAVSIISIMILSASNTAFLAIIKQVTDEGFVKKSPDKVIFLPLILFSLMAIRALASYFSSYGMRYIARHVVAALRQEAFARMMQLPVPFFDSSSAGMLVSKLTFDAERLSMVTTRVALNVIRDALTALGVVCYMLYLDWRLTMIFALVAPLMGLYLRKTTPKLRSGARQVQHTVGEMTKSAEEAISGQRIVKIFGATDYEYDRFSKVVIKNRSTEMRQTRIAGC
jgi:subfamily B ATP-binding cassette protein MsbA